MTVGALEVLRAAVNLARDEQIRKVATLQARLNQVFPNRAEDVAIALSKWADYVRENGCDT